MKKSLVLILHLGYWVTYLFLLLTLVFFLQGHFIFHGLRLAAFLAVFAFFPGMLGFYSFYSRLFPRFLAREKIGSLLGSAILTVAGIGFLGIVLLFLVWNFMIPHNGPSITQGGVPEIIALICIMAINAFLCGIVGLVLRGFINWYSDIQIKKDLKKKNDDMELALIKSQISPHFLFNTINNIDVMIEKNSQLASAYLHKLSGILRFLLYESKTEKIALGRELLYIGEYIDLQKIRTANTKFVNYSVEGNPDRFMIEPMLFVPFVENAFKHEENKRVDNGIQIKFIIGDDRIVFECENQYDLNSRDKSEHSGIGNELIQKRLILLYPGTHHLNITDSHGRYAVKLTLMQHVA